MNIINIIDLVNINTILVILIFSILILSIFITNITFIRIGLYFTIFIMLKWLFDYRLCTFGYYECKLRKVKKNEGYINKFCDYFGDIIYSKYNYMFYIILIIVNIINAVKFINLTHKYI